MFVRHTLLGFLVGAMLVGPAGAAQAEASLAVDAEGFTSGDGHAVARIYAAGDDVMGEPRWTVRAEIAQGRARFEKSLPPGRYAVVVYHDRNDNDRLDHNMFGFPAEPLGSSGGFELSLTSGLPSFAKLRFDLPAAGTAIRVRVH
jgi:uncharacterized protein (DUF2141 family)